MYYCNKVIMSHNGGSKSRRRLVWEATLLKGKHKKRKLKKRKEIPAKIKH